MSSAVRSALRGAAPADGPGSFDPRWNYAAGVALVTLVFVLATVSTMLTAVSLSLWGLAKLKVERLTPYADVLAGTTLSLCGGAILAGL